MVLHAVNRWAVCAGNERGKRRSGSAPGLVFRLGFFCMEEQSDYRTNTGDRKRVVSQTDTSGGVIFVSSEYSDDYRREIEDVWLLVIPGFNTLMRARLKVRTCNFVHV